MKHMIFALLLATFQSAWGHQDEPLQYRISLQFIEMPHTTLTEILATQEKNGQRLHDKTMALSKSGQAKILETCLVVCRSGQRACTESVREEIFPTEYEPPELPLYRPLTQEEKAALPPKPLRHPSLRGATAFEARHTGITLEVEATTSSDGMVDLRLAPELVTPLRIENWMKHVDAWGDASVLMPTYEVLRLLSSIHIKPGQFEIVGLLTPKMRDQGPVITRKIIVFARVDFLTNP
jgi:Flp pilus assembly secretin CpaC